MIEEEKTNFPKLIETSEDEIQQTDFMKLIKEEFDNDIGFE